MFNRSEISHAKQQETNPSNIDDAFYILSHPADFSAELVEWIATAKSMGEDAGRDQGKWAADGNTTDEHRRKVLTMLDAGDPEAHDYLPNEPNLSGEWADDLTPSRLYETITGKSAAPTDSDWTEADGNLCDALCAAWEEGVSETFVSACEAELS